MNFVSTVQYLQQAQDQKGNFPLLYSAKKGGLPWICGQVSKEEEFFLRAFPPIVTVIEQSKYKDNLYKLKDIGYQFSEAQLQHIEDNYDIFIQNSSDCWIPKNLKYSLGSPIDQFITTYKQLFPEKYHKLQTIETKLDCNMGVRQACKFLYLDVYYAPTPIYMFHTTDQGEEIPIEEYYQQ